MKYSYTKARVKTPLSPELKLVMAFFGMTLLMLMLTYGFLIYKDYSFLKDKEDVIISIADYDTKIINMKEKISFIEQQNLLAQKISTQNIVLKDSITNLFDLVPQRITLSEATLLKNGLILYGITPNKDVYNFMLQAPLRSIFHKTYSSFYPAKNGWLRFVSTNYVDDKEEIIKEDEDED